MTEWDKMKTDGDEMMTDGDEMMIEADMTTMGEVSMTKGGRR